MNDYLSDLRRVLDRAEEIGLSASQLCLMANPPVSRATLYRWLKGGRSPLVSNLREAEGRLKAALEREEARLKAALGMAA